jgi:hypothetical protein
LEQEQSNPDGKLKIGSGHRRIIYVSALKTPSSLSMAKAAPVPLGKWVPSPLKKKSKEKRKVILIHEHAKRQQDIALRQLLLLQQKARQRLQSIETDDVFSLHSDHASNVCAVNTSHSLISEDPPGGPINGVETDTSISFHRNDIRQPVQDRKDKVTSQLISESMVDESTMEVDTLNYVPIKVPNVESLTSEDMLEEVIEGNIVVDLQDISSLSPSECHDDSRIDTSDSPSGPTSQQSNLYMRWKAVIPKLASTYMVFKKMSIENEKTALLEQNIIESVCTSGCGIKGEREVICLFLERELQYFEPLYI